MYRTYFTAKAGNQTSATTQASTKEDAERAVRWACGGDAIVIHASWPVCGHCMADCKPQGVGTGYAVLGTAPNEHFVCYACADNLQHAMKTE